MRMFAVAAVLAAVLAGTATIAQAQTAADRSKMCGEAASKQRLAGQALADFLTQCFSGQMPSMSRQQCQAEARKQGLTGEALGGFMNRCLAGEAMMQK